VNTVADADRLFDPDPTFGVRELADRIRGVLDRTFPGEVWVRGEIRNLSRSRSGHVYFDLVEPPDPGREPNAVVSVVLFDDARQIVNRILTRAGAVKMSDGVEIRLRGVVDFYAPRGRLQVRMTSIDPEYTLGRLAADRERVLAALADEGLLALQKTLAFALVPLRVGLVTSADSAACADVCEQLAASGHGWRVTIVDTRVQGPTADRWVAEAVMRAARLDVDVIAVVRGGGARTELATFDSDLLARVIARCEVPVVTGIGHEIDTSIADEVAHEAHKTPTACAQALIDRVRSFEARVWSAWSDVAVESRRHLTDNRRRVDHAGRRTADASRAPLRAGRQRLDGTDRAVRREARRHVAAGRRHLDVAGGRLFGGARGRTRRARTVVEATRRTLLRDAARALAPHRRRLEVTGAVLDGRDPARLLARGWSITRRTDGRIVRSASDVTPGDTIVTRLADGTVTSTVDGCEGER
jgi:exodeoxyribonuclease VII large subunit